MGHLESGMNQDLAAPGMADGDITRRHKAPLSLFSHGRIADACYKTYFVATTKFLLNYTFL